MGAAHRRECRGLQYDDQQMETQNIPQDIVDAMYIGDAPHDMFIGEVVDIIRSTDPAPRKADYVYYI